mmetsp:Transcript_61034/g.175055  ORF Transcript_61034/g.175055 Transcript_61034/m.175055 type:complete len:216 (+) Transcript_61034:535-1182(+)
MCPPTCTKLLRSASMSASTVVSGLRECAHAGTKSVGSAMLMHWVSSSQMRICSRCAAAVAKGSHSVPNASPFVARASRSATRSSARAERSARDMCSSPSAKSASKWQHRTKAAPPWSTSPLAKTRRNNQKQPGEWLPVSIRCSRRRTWSSLRACSRSSRAASSDDAASSSAPSSGWNAAASAGPPPSTRFACKGRPVVGGDQVGAPSMAPGPAID